MPHQRVVIKARRPAGNREALGLGGGINPYVFANNDPINGADPSGMSAWIDPLGDGGDGYDPSCTYTVRFQYSGDPTLANAVGPIAVLDSTCSYKHDDSPPHPKTPATGRGAGHTSSSAKPTPKWRSAACALSVLEFGAATIETGAVGIEAAPLIMAADGIAAASSALAGVVVTHMADVGTTYLDGGGKMINTNATVARTMLNHMYGYGEGALVSTGLGHSFGIVGYLKDITPGVNVYYAYKAAKHACR